MQNTVEYPAEGGYRKLIIIPIRGVFNFSAAPGSSGGGVEKVFALICLQVSCKARAEDKGHVS